MTSLTLPGENKTKEFFIPAIEGFWRILPFDPRNLDREISHKLKAIYGLMSCIEPVEVDERRELWIEVKRGDAKDFGDYEDFKKEGEVDTYDQFIELWQEYFPEKTQWYSFATMRYKEEMFFFFNEKQMCVLSEKEDPEIPERTERTVFHDFVDWLFIRVDKEIRKLKKNKKAYNDHIKKHLSWNRRTGKIRRRDYWDILGKYAIRLDERLGRERIKVLEKIVKERIREENIPVLPQMTAGDFFRYCEICYDANGYFDRSTEKLSAREKYLRMADGRDEGLRDLPENSQEAFRQWYSQGARAAGHPWEICRGGNSTHISLYVIAAREGWYLRLSGSSTVRVEETVKMAVALHERNIPFVLTEAEAILRMVKGEDYIGIVPEPITPAYCHSMFPPEDKIIDFMNLDWDRKDEIIAKADWYPVKEITRITRISKE